MTENGTEVNFQQSASQAAEDERFADVWLKAGLTLAADGLRPSPHPHHYLAGKTAGPRTRLSRLRTACRRALRGPGLEAGVRIPAIRVAASADEASAVGAVVLAFGGDPIVRWCWPDSPRSNEHVSLYRAFGGGAFRTHHAFCTEVIGGAALWLPPNVHPDEAVLDDIAGADRVEPTRGELPTMLEQMAAYPPRTALVTAAHRRGSRAAGSGYGGR